jgi:hypothetical protein
MKASHLTASSRVAALATAILLAGSGCGSTFATGEGGPDAGGGDVTTGGSTGSGGSGGNGTGGSDQSGGGQVGGSTGTGGIEPCPPCEAPPDPSCFGLGICGCGPYICPDAGADAGSPGDLESSCGGDGAKCPASPPLDGASCAAQDLCCNYVVPPAMPCPTCELGMRGCICSSGQWHCGDAACACAGGGDAAVTGCEKNSDCGPQELCVSYVSNIGPSTSVQRSCKANPCGDKTLSCTCAAPVCPGGFPICYVNGDQISCDDGRQ